MPLASSAHPPPPPASLKQRVFACLNRLADRDTHGAACGELEALARGLEPSSFASFVSCIHSTDASDKAPVRKQCVRLLAVLAESHGDALAPHLSKILSAVVRRLRDADSAVRSACVDAVAALRRHVGRPPFTAFLKPLADALFTEQDQNSQIGAALCLAAAVDAAPPEDPDRAARLAKLMPRLEKLLRCESFKAKPALLSLIGSAIGAGGASAVGEAALRSLVPAVVHFLSSEDWAARKAAAEALARLAAVERDALSEFKAGNLKTFESRRFDKVKVVREVMKQMLEAWKLIPDVSGDFSPPPDSMASSKENASDGRYPPGSRNVAAAGSEARKQLILPTRSTPPDSSYATTVRKRNPMKGKDKKTSSSTFSNKPLNREVEIGVSNAASATKVLEDGVKERDENASDKKINEKIKLSKLETKRALFHKNSDEKVHKFRSGSRVAPCQEESKSSTVVVSNVTGDFHKNHTECEDLSLIQNQLVQIEKQQSSLMDLLQRFIGSSQHGMRSLETRVHGLEIALDEISHDLALSSGRMSKTESARVTCCMPGADFLSYKFWRRTESRLAAPRISTSSGTPSVAAMRYRDDANGIAERLKLNRRFQLQGGGLIVNPLAEIQSDSRGNQEVVRR